MVAPGPAASNRAPDDLPLHEPARRYTPRSEIPMRTHITHALALALTLAFGFTVTACDKKEDKKEDKKDDKKAEEKKAEGEEKKEGDGGW
jgi:hypothetical protein